MVRFIARAVFVSAGLVILWIVASLVVAQSQPSAVPFSSTPDVPGFYQTPMGRAGNAFLRKLDGSYLQIQFLAPFSYAPPYTLLSSAQAYYEYALGGQALLTAPAGPPNVGLASKLGAGGKFAIDGSPGIATISLLRNRSSVSVFLGTLTPSFVGTTLYSVGTEVGSVLAADFNGDGALDLAVPYLGNNAQGAPPGGVGVLINKGDGTFNASVSYSAGIHPQGVASLDVNHDNKLDLVVADNGASSIYVLLGNGNGTFAAGVPYSASGVGLSVTIADFNGDGNPDLASSSMDNRVTVLLGNGDGTFRPGSNFATGRFPRYIAAADLNKDGKIDLVTANAQDQTVTIFSGLGNGNFQQTSSYIVGYNTGSLTITDFNQDGILDIVTGEGDARLLARDYDSDQMDFLIGRGDGTFIGASSTSTRNSFSSTTFLETADFNGDGIPDAVVNDYYQSMVFILRGGSNASFQAPTAITLTSSGRALASAAASGDFNGDGRPDLAVTEEGPGQVAILLNNGGNLQSPSTFSSGGSKPRGVVTADFDGDGKLDLAVTNTGSGKTMVFRGGGNGAFQSMGSYSTGNAPGHLAAADINGDGRVDIIVADEGVQGATNTQGGIYILLNSGGGNFQPPVGYPATFLPANVSVGDLNGDGIPDLAVPGQDNSFNFHLGTLRGNGNGTFQSVQFLETDYGPSSVAIRDFNGDGKPDMVVAHCCGDTDMGYYAGNGDGTFQAEVHFNGGASPMDVKIADLDKNGTPDLVIAGNDGAVTGLLNTSAGSAVCTLTPTVVPAGSSGGNFVISVASGTCDLTVTGLPNWITVSTTTAGSITLSVAANPGAARSATFNIGAISVTVNQAAVSSTPTCTYSISPPGQAFSSAGGSGTINILTQAGCPWSVTGAPAWTVFSSPISGSGNAALTYTVAVNGGSFQNTAFKVAGLDYYAEQSANVTGLNLVGALAQMASAGTWETTITLVNNGNSYVIARTNLFADGGGPLLLPLTLPQGGFPLSAASLDRNLAPHASLILDTTGPDSQPVQVGSAQLLANGALGGYAIFKYKFVGQEAVVPLEMRNAPSYILAFDNTNGTALGVALQNVAGSSASVHVVIRDDAGALLGTDTIVLAGNGHTSFVLPQQYQVTANKRGTIEFDTPAAGQISALGIRFTPPGTQTTIPVLANVTTSGGTVPHIASGGGWKTTVVLVNTGATSAQAHLKFFGDDGTPLSLPLVFPQSGTNSTATQVDRAMNANASLIIESQGSDTSPVQIGSMQLTTDGKISGYVIFRYTVNGQEASTPFENRGARVYAIAFDHTGGMVTGTAVNNASGLTANIPVTIRDDQGNVIGTGSIQLPANGHTAFSLASLFPATANIRGTVEFQTPGGVQINVLGIRSPPSLTFTTLPPITR